MATITDSSCLNPRPPSWQWRYNRNKKLLRFEHWTTRLERWPPYYRNMGLPDNFRFHALVPEENEQQSLQLGANYAHDLVISRQPGFGNAALGQPPGPAPPRLVVYDIHNPNQQDDLYKVNEFNNVSTGMSLLDHTRLPHPESDNSKVPLNPRQYLELTLSQQQGYPGTFPHYNSPVPNVSHRCERVCGSSLDQESLSPLKFWKHKQIVQERMHALNSHLKGRLL